MAEAMQQEGSNKVMKPIQSFVKPKTRDIPHTSSQDHLQHSRECSHNDLHTRWDQTRMYEHDMS